MSTTTIRLPQQLKKRIARAAERAGTTAHSFIIDTLAEKADQEERRLDFLDAADERFARAAASGRTIAWQDMRRYLEKRAAGKKAAKPRARSTPD